MEVSEKIVKELEKIRKDNDGVLRCADVVEFARNPKTALHSRFTWDDSVAAREYRLWQAREIIRVVVTVLPKTETETRCFVSLGSDRVNDGGGYRAMYDVLRSPDMRAELLEQAKAEAKAYRAKYGQLTELASIFAAMDNLFGK